MLRCVGHGYYSVSYMSAICYKGSQCGFIHSSGNIHSPNSIICDIGASCYCDPYFTKYCVIEEITNNPSKYTTISPRITTFQLS